MGVTNRYWSIEDCAWVDSPPRDEQPAEVSVPQQREDAPAVELTEA